MIPSFHRPSRRAPRAALLALAALLPLAPLSPAAPTVTMDVQPRLIQFGESATLSIRFENFSTVPSLAPPDIDGLQISGPSTSHRTSFVNGRSSSSASLDFRIFPRRAGEYEIGPYSLSIDGAAYDLPAVTLTVRPPPELSDAATADSSAPSPLFARVVLPASPPYLHQTFPLTIDVYALPSVNLTRQIRFAAPPLPESGFSSGDFSLLAPERVEQNGVVYDRLRIQAPVRALAAGDYPVAPVLSVGIQRPRSARSRPSSPFGLFDDDDFFSPFGAPVDMVDLPADPVTLTIRPLPTENRPADFSGAVGTFRFTADVRPRELAAGEPLTVALTLTGDGNLDAARPPAYSDTPAYKAYEPKLAATSPTHKQYDQVVIPRTDALLELPALSFAYFDPDASAYRTLTVGPFPLTVHPAPDGAKNALLLQTASDPSSPAPATLVLGTDIHYLHPAPAHWNPSPADPLALRTLPLTLLPPAALALLAAAWIRRRRDRLAADPALARRRSAPRSARMHLRRAEEALRSDPSSPAPVFNALTDAVHAYFAHRLNLPPGAADFPLIMTRLSASPLPPSDLDKWRDFLTLADQIRYASTPLSPAKLSDWISTVSDLLRQAERIPL